MKTIKRENRVETINDTELPAAIKRGWREIDPVTGDPIVAESAPRSLDELEAENARLKNRLAELEAQVAADVAPPADRPANEAHNEAPRGKGKAKAADKQAEADTKDAETAGDAANETTAAE